MIFFALSQDIFTNKFHRRGVADSTLKIPVQGMKSTSSLTSFCNSFALSTGRNTSEFGFGFGLRHFR